MVPSSLTKHTGEALRPTTHIVAALAVWDNLHALPGPIRYAMTPRFFATRLRFLVPLVLATLLFAAESPRQEPATIADQLSTPERVRKPGWWPTKGTSPREDFLGSEACAKCHASLFATQRMHAMARTAVRARDSEILKTHELSTTVGPYQYRITRGGDGYTYSVSDGEHTISGPLTWAFGLGRLGQSYFFDYNKTVYLVPFSFYNAPQSFDWTVDQPHDTPPSLEAALGKPLSADELHGCFACHNTASTVNGRYDSEHMIPGVTCEACHGPGANHVAAAQAGLNELANSMMLNPRFRPVDSVDFCGACHRTWWDVTLAGARGAKSVRFQPYRIENSKCWGTGDHRLTCVACHDPHKPLVRDSSAYDGNCLACHSAGKAAAADHPGPACPKATTNCTSCHMQTIDLPNIHGTITDHHIRIVRSGEPLPD